MYGFNFGEREIHIDMYQSQNKCPKKPDDLLQKVMTDKILMTFELYDNSIKSPTIKKLNKITNDICNDKKLRERIYDYQASIGDDVNVPLHKVYDTLCSGDRSIDRFNPSCENAFQKSIISLRSYPDQTNPIEYDAKKKKYSRLERGFGSGLDFDVEHKRLRELYSRINALHSDQRILIKKISKCPKFSESEFRKYAVNILSFGLVNDNGVYDSSNKMNVELYDKCKNSKTIEKIRKSKSEEIKIYEKLCSNVLYGNNKLFPEKCDNYNKSYDNLNHRGYIKTKSIKSDTITDRGIDFLLKTTTLDDLLKIEEEANADFIDPFSDYSQSKKPKRTYSSDYESSFKESSPYTSINYDTLDYNEGVSMLKFFDPFQVQKGRDFFS